VAEVCRNCQHPYIEHIDSAQNIQAGMGTDKGSPPVGTVGFVVRSQHRGMNIHHGHIQRTSPIDLVSLQHLCMKRPANITYVWCCSALSLHSSNLILLLFFWFSFVLPICPSLGGDGVLNGPYPFAFVRFECTAIVVVVVALRAFAWVPIWIRHCACCC
jgi:hypothetical protein